MHVSFKQYDEQLWCALWWALYYMYMLNCMQAALQVAVMSITGYSTVHYWSSELIDRKRNSNNYMDSQKYVNISASAITHISTIHTHTTHHTHTHKYISTSIYIYIYILMRMSAL